MDCFLGALPALAIAKVLGITLTDIDD